METPPPGPGNVKPQSPPAGAGVGEAGVGARRYPKPPVFFSRLGLFLLKPESWAAAARYPSRFTFIPLAVVIVVSTLVISISFGVRFSRAVDLFAVHFPAMDFSSEGVLKPKAAYGEPPRFSFFGYRFIVDPLKTMSLDSVRSAGACVITDREVVIPNMSGSDVRCKISAFSPMLVTMPKKGETATVDGASLRGAAPVLGFWTFFITGVLQFFGDVFWTVLILFFLCPLITLAASAGEGGLILPKRAAYRMAAAMLIPLLSFNALMTAAGYPISAAIPDLSFRWLFWLLVASGMAIWTGVTARKMFGPTRKKIMRQG